MAGFSEGMQAGHLIAQDTIDLFNTGYSVYQDQRNYDFSQDVFDYNKALQQQIFDREDTAYERKRRDLERAGLNPNLAAGGSGASAGQVVGNSNQAGDHQLYKANLMQNFGAYLSAKKASEEAKQAEYMTEYMRNKVIDQENDRDNQNTMEYIENLYDSGTDISGYKILTEKNKRGQFSVKVFQDEYELGTYLARNGYTYYDGKDLEGGLTTGIVSAKNGARHLLPYGVTRGELHDGNRPFSIANLSDSKYWLALEYGWAEAENDLSMSNDDTAMSAMNRRMLGVDEEWQTADKWIDRVGRILDRFTGAVHGIADMTSAVRPYKKNNPLLKRKSKVWNRNSSVETYQY